MTEPVHTWADVDGHLEIDCDVCIIGSGAGGSVLAAGLAAHGHDVVVLEAGGNFTRADFHGDESVAYPQMYQERGARASAEVGITVLQGRTVGGGTTVNWTTCFRTPDRILERWAEVHGVRGWSPSDLAPHFDAVEDRLGIATWDASRANANNKVLLDGCEALGWQVEPLRRNVRGCVNSGQCGTGCPIDAKQGMAITYLADARENGARVYAGARVDTLIVEGDRVAGASVTMHDPTTDRPTGATMTVRARRTVSSAGAINGPALMIRSGLDRAPLGRRTMLHPVVALPALYDTPINGFYGAPQSISSHEFVDRGADRVGYFLETPPLQPMLAASGSTIFGRSQQDFMRQLPNIGVLIALSIDGLVDGDEGGVVTLRNDGRIHLDYPVRPALVEAFRDAHRSMARIALAAGATQVQSTHLDPVVVTSEADIARFDNAPFGLLEHSIFTAHQMGGCAMGDDPARSVVSSELAHHDVDDLYVVDGSVFPTALGVNPSETIYGIAHRAVDILHATL